MEQREVAVLAMTREVSASTVALVAVLERG